MTVVENTLSYEIDTVGTSPELDNACKQLLAEKIILAWIMHSCLDEYKEIDVNEIVEKYIEGNPEISTVGVMTEQTNRKINGMANDDVSMNEGMVRYDIRFHAYAPKGNEKIRLIINIEAQNKYNNSYPLITRAIYYLSRMISAQHGTEFDKSHYGEIKKVYSVWVCINPPRERENTILRYRIAEEQMIGTAKENPAHYDLMTAIMICLGESINNNQNDILKLLGVLMSNTMSATDKKKILTNDFDIPMSDQFDREVEKMCNVSAGIIEKSINIGFNQGMEKGIEKGIDIGREKCTLDFIRSLISEQMTFEQAATTLRIPNDSWEKYRKLLNSED